MENKLRSMVDFVLVEYSIYDKFDYDKLISIKKYAEFLKRPLELWMFVPCYLRNGIWIPYTKETLLNSMELFTEFEQAKERVLFEGFENKEQQFFPFDFENRTIEDLVKYNLTLTNNALKIWE